MKITNSEVRSKKAELRRQTAADLLPSAFCLQPSRQGMALVITLIMLSVTLIMAVAFLAIARRERGAVTTTTDTATARLAAETALAGAEAQIVANIFSTTNAAAYDFSLLVSTNYINANGFDPNSGSPTNVNYDYLITGSPTFTALEAEQNISNLWFLPRAPVFVTTNTVTGSNTFRFFLDLNRNGEFEANGFVPNVEIIGGLVVTNNLKIFQVGDPEWVGILERPDQPHGPNNHFLARYAFLAQPIGNSLDLNAIHNQTITKTVNPASAGSDGYFRNQGVGSWEINLAAFLADLNTNQWLPFAPSDPSAIGFYQYNEPFGFNINKGRAFDDARALLSYRYNNFYNNLASANFLYANAPNIFPFDNIDGYSDGPLQTTITNIDESFLVNQDKSGLPWAGADNPNRYFTLGDFFDKTKTQSGVVGLGFTDHLLNAGTNVSTYDRYTFYRMLSELGTDSAQDDSRMNLNYRNVTNGAVLIGLETNFYPWTATEFFTNAADRLLRSYTTNWFRANPAAYLATYYGIIPAGYLDANGIGVTNVQYLGQTNELPAFGLANIPVRVNGSLVYSPAVNRLLQLAANLYDASTNSANVPGNIYHHDYPHVFRPTFFRDLNGNIFITGYQEVVSVIGTADVKLSSPVDLNGLLTGSSVANYPNGINVYGVPWIIGAKKGLPNFNEFYMRNAVQLTRKLQVTRTDANTPGATRTNEMFIMSITNRVGFSFWNSYNTNYSSGNNLTVYFSDILGMTLTNNAPKTFPPFYGNPPLVQYTFITNLTSWSGSFWTTSGSTAPENQSATPASFIAGVYEFPFLPESVFRAGFNDFVPTYTNPSWETNTTSVPVFPQFGLMTTNRVQAFILDGSHVIDYVQFSGPNGTRVFDDRITGFVDWDPIGSGQNAGKYLYWSTNSYGVGASSPTPTWGVVNQLTVSRKPSLAGITAWKTPTDMPQALSTVPLEGQYFDAFFAGGAVVANGKLYANTNLSIQAPYTPTRTAWDYILWQANDPLVHYLASDLNTTTRDTGSQRSDNLVNVAFPTISLNSVGDRYQPWGRNMQMASLGETKVDTNSYNLRFRDSLVWGSDYWDFPAGKYPTVGWIGRVHRGTPWQTVYLKARNVLEETISTPDGLANIGTNTWAQWTGDTQTAFNQQYDAVNSAPVSDGALFDLFTAQFNDNATRGTLSVNQTHLAAWSALLSGVVALTNMTDFPANYAVPVVTNLIVQPAGLDAQASALWNIVTNINDTRFTFTNADGLVGVFEHVGDILRVPAFTERSPFLNHIDDTHTAYDISDELYEWLPQQTIGLLRVSATPRYVIYGYGQTLTPAVNGEVTSGPFFGLVTNYQVTAESAVRAVVSVHAQVTATGTGFVTNYTTTVESYNVLPPD